MTFLRVPASPRKNCPSAPDTGAVGQAGGPAALLASSDPLLPHPGHWGTPPTARSSPACPAIARGSSSGGWRGQRIRIGWHRSVFGVQPPGPMLQRSRVGQRAQEIKLKGATCCWRGPRPSSCSRSPSTARAWDTQQETLGTAAAGLPGWGCLRPQQADFRHQEPELVAHWELGKWLLDSPVQRAGAGRATPGSARLPVGGWWLQGAGSGVPEQPPAMLAGGPRRGQGPAVW